MLTPVGEYVLVLPDKMSDMTEGGVFIPEKSRANMQTGWVVAVGEGGIGKHGRRSPKVKPQQRVVFDYYAGVDWEEGGRKFLIMPEREIYLRIEQCQ